MTRPLRLEFENAWYHVMNRGSGRCDIFLTDGHRNKFLEIVSCAVDIFGIELHAYCLMNNHYHLLVKTPRGNLSRAMRHIHGVYIQRFLNLAHTPVIFGVKHRKEQLLGKIHKIKIKSSLPDYRRSRVLPTLKEVSRCCANYFNVKEAELYRVREGGAG